MSPLPQLPPPPSEPGAYRWYYADVAAGELSAVFIFMVGSLFSPRYSVAARRGGLPREHCAVNFALYHRGLRRRWVLSEYASMEQASPRELRIGRSRLSYEGDRVRMQVDDRTAPWGRPVRASLVLDLMTPVGDEVQLVPGLPHWWQPLAPRSRAWLTVETEGLELEGLGYHDTNHGAEQLGSRLSGWHWSRTHGENETVVDYVLPEGTPSVRLSAGPHGLQCQRGSSSPVLETERTNWGLRVPRHLLTGTPVHGAARLLESSPFYARVEARPGGANLLGEVADFRRFHSPLIRWMAHFRTRVEGRS